jgi:hypothetical protein
MTVGNQRLDLGDLHATQATQKSEHPHYYNEVSHDHKMPPAAREAHTTFEQHLISGKRARLAGAPPGIRPEAT